MAQHIPPLHSFRHIAVIQTAFVGDVALVLYLMQTLRALHPNAVLTLVTTPLGASLAQHCPAINHVIGFDKRKQQRGFAGMKLIAQQLRSLKVECILAPHRSLRTTLVSLWTRPAWSVGFRKNTLAWLYRYRVPYPTTHEAERNLYLLTGMVESLPEKAVQPMIIVPTADRDRIQELIEPLRSATSENAKTLIALAPGSVWATKRYTLEHIQHVAHTLINRGYGVVLVGSAEDAGLCRAIEEFCKNHPRAGLILNCAGGTSLIELIELLRHCSAILTNDSAPTHLANLAGCRVVSVFGPTLPEFGFAPRGVEDCVVERRGLPCRPCSSHGSQVCPIGTHECMTSISPEEIIRELISGRTLS